MSGDSDDTESGGNSVRISKTLATLGLAVTVALAAIPLLTSDSSPDGAPAPSTIARPEYPAAPDQEPSRREDGGPDERRTYELRRLVDPATGLLPVDIFAREQRFAQDLPLRSGENEAGRLDDWVFRGPHNVGGRTRALAIDISDPTYRTLLAGGVSGGMWRSTDEGASWELTTGTTQLHSVTTVAQDTRPGFQNVWYYGTGELRGNSAAGGSAPYRGDGMFRSTDGGASWTALPATVSGTPDELDSPWDYVHRIVVDPTNAVEDELYAATYGVIFRSTDGGDSWTGVLGTDTDGSRYTDLVIASDGVLYASLSSDGPEAGIWRSPDGLAWTRIGPPGLTTHGRIVMGLAPSEESIMYALVADVHGGTSEGFYRYEYLGGDGSGSGGLWDDRSASLANLSGGPYGTYDVESYSSYCQVVTVAPDDPDLVFVGGIHITRSTDGFATAQNTDWIGGWLYTDHHADQHWLVFQPGSSSVVLTGSDGGVHKTLDVRAPTVSWTSLNNGYNTSQFYTVALDETVDGSDIVLGGMQDNGTYWTSMTDPMAPWVEIWSGDGCYCAAVNTDEAVGEYYVSSQRGRVYYEGLDQNGNWVEWTRLDPTGGGDYLFVNPFILDPNDDNIMYLASSNGVWRNDDLRDLRANHMWESNTQTLHWDRLTIVPGDDPVTALAVTRDEARRLYYGTANGGLYRVNNPHSTISGLPPIILPSPESGYVTSIAVDPHDDQTIMVAYSNYNVRSLWLSDDGGQSWRDVEGNLGGADGPSVRSVAVIRSSHGATWFAGTSVGLYATSDIQDDPVIWEREADELIGTVVVDFLATRQSDRLLAVGTHGKGVYAVELSDPVLSAPQDLVAAGGVAASASPNPFNPQTTIEYVVPDAGRVRLAIHDLHGRRVAVLVEDDVAAGRHQAVWRGRDDAGRAVASGTYLYRLETARGSTQGKVQLVK
jgi:hypothetical protein